MLQINPNLSEGLGGDLRALNLADVRGIIRRKIEGPGGYPSWTKADAIGKSLVPTMAAQTIINFAYGKTIRPSPWTIKKMCQVAQFRMVALPYDVPLPQGAIEM